MELVYLWVKDYKNIKKQGFNFSPRFECKYDEETNELSINENEDYVSIFPENINITAIVGENGSGKSSLIHQLITPNIIQCSPFTDITFDKKLWINTNTVLPNNTYIDDLSIDNNIILYTEDIDSYLFKNKYSASELTASFMELKDRYKIHNILISFLSHIEDLGHLSELNFIPSHIEFQFTKDIDLDVLIGYQFEYDNNNDSTSHMNVDSSIIYDIKKLLTKYIESSIEYYESNNDIKKYLFIKEFIYKLSKKDAKSLVIFQNIVLNTYEFQENFFKELDNKLYQLEKEDIFNAIIDEFNSFNIQDNSIKLKDNNLEKLLSNIHRGFFEIDFYELKDNQKIYLSDLSSGEQKILTMFAKIFYIARKVYTNDKNFLLILDEVDTYLHPNWQKKIFTYLSSFLSKLQIFNSKKINIVITTHSPFILSDLPKENVIFLENGKQVHPNIETFGANIHTLLSHGFFMKNGLMGEFAKGKINEAIKILHQKQLSQKDISFCENIIAITGEPLIKRQMQKMLDSKRLAEVDKIDKIQKQIAQLQTELQEMKND